ncbi:prepilin-type N-terminal cleavage/methylation domain-containing protein [Candidatus Nomurabacteria bacterium]|nr:prepilin-type N-terminal cleavage/methylation domain-containing protein [Candidatus Nomurabacteria bacterium]
MKKNISGFTIVELLIAVVVIAILAAITIVSFGGFQSRAKDSAVRSGIANAVKVLEASKTIEGVYPTSLSATAVGSAVGNNPNIKYEYTVNGSGDTSGFCLTAVYDEITLSTTSENTSNLQPGACPGHSDPNEIVPIASLVSGALTFNPPGDATTTYPLDINFEPSDTLVVLKSQRYLGAVRINVHGSVCNQVYSANIYTGSTRLSACIVTGLSGTGDIEVSVPSTTLNSTNLTLIPLRGLSSNAIRTEGAGWGMGPNNVKHTTNAIPVKRGQVAIIAAATYYSDTLAFPLDPQPTSGWNVIRADFGNDRHTAAYFIPSEDTSVSASLQNSRKGYSGITMFVVGD